MIVVGLTGSIGMGKSTVARMFEEEGAPIFDSDAVVHALYQRGGLAVAPVEAAFPGVIVEGAVDRALLSARVVADPQAIGELERIVHPLVFEAQARFLEHHSHAGTPIVVMDVPLLFENGRQGAFDKTVVVSAPAEVQRERVMARPGMTVEKFEAILARQMPDAEKRGLADFVIDTGGPLSETRRQVRDILDALREHN